VCLPHGFASGAFGRAVSVAGRTVSRKKPPWLRTGGFPYDATLSRVIVDRARCATIVRRCIQGGAVYVGNRLLDALKLRPGETTTVVLMALYLFLAVSAFITGRISRDALFLKDFDKDALAFMYITVAIAVPVPAYLYARVADRFRRDRIIIITNAALGVALLAIYALLLTDAKWVIIVLYNFVELAGVFLMIQFWTFASDVFSSRQAKRVFPVIGGGGTMAGAVCGVAVGNLGRSFGAGALILVMVLLLAIGIALVAHIGRRERARLQELVVGRTATKKTNAFKVRSEIADVFKSKHLKIIAGMTMMTFITVPLIDYQFKVMAKAYFTVDNIIDQNGLTHFFGLFYTVTGIIAAITQFGFASRILERYGVVTSLLILPVSLLLGSVATVASRLMSTLSMAAFSAAVFTKGAENSFRYSVYDATMQVIYTPVPSDVRGRAKTFIDGILKPWAGGIAGALITLVVGPFNLEPTSLSWVALVLIVAWTLLVLAIRREYVAQLLATLRRRRLDFGDTALTVSDEATVKILKNALTSSDAGEVRNALALAARVTNHDLSEDIVPLLGHEAGDVRLRALEILAERGALQHVERIRELFDDESEDVAAGAIRAYCAIVGEPALRVVARHLDSPHPLVRGASVASLIRHGGLEGILVSAEHLKAMQTASDEGTRLAAAFVFRDIGVKNFYQPVLALMRDTQNRVQQAAIAAAGAMRSPELIPALIYKLARRETARLAANALVQYGPEIVPTLGKVLCHEPEDTAIRRQIPRILERIGDEGSFETLLRALDVRDPDTRREAARSAARVREKLGLKVDEARVRGLVDKEIRAQYQLLCALEDLKPVAGTSGPDLLRDALEERVARTLDRIMRMLGIIYPLKSMELIQANLSSTVVATKGNAIEVLDNLLDNDQKRRLLPLVEDLPREKIVEAGLSFYTLERRSPEDWIGELLSSEEPWLVVVALYVIRELGLSHLLEKVLTHLDHRDPVVRETALRTLSVLVPPERLVDEASSLLDDSDAHVRRYATFIADEASRYVTHPPTQAAVHA
jgi:ATP/ADP translocase/HEAT repeat protein